MDEQEKILMNLLQELRRGTLVLTVLLIANEPYYGYNMVTKLRDMGVDIEQNTLYPLLRRLEKQGLLESRWDTNEARPRKYYRISGLGEEIKMNLILEWENSNKIIQEFK